MASVEQERSGVLGRVRTSPKLQRRLMIGAIAFAAVAAAVFSATLMRYSTSTPENSLAGEKIVLPPKQHTVPLADETKAIAEQWILGAVSRNDLASTYDLTHQDILGGMSRAEWNEGTIAVVPYPIETPDHAEWKVSYSLNDEALLKVRLTPPERLVGKIRPLTFFIGLVKVGSGENATWKVNYWAPDYKPPVRWADA